MDEMQDAAESGLCPRGQQLWGYVSDLDRMAICKAGMYYQINALDEGKPSDDLPPAPE